MQQQSGKFKATFRDFNRIRRQARQLLNTWATFSREDRAALETIANTPKVTPAHADTVLRIAARMDRKEIVL